MHSALVAVLTLVALSSPARAETPSAQSVRASVILTEPEALNDSAPSTPPLEIDSATPIDPHEFDVSLIGDCDTVHNGGRCDAGIMLNYGIRENVDAYFYRAYERVREDGQTVSQGLTPTEAGIKIRVLNKRGWQVAVAPAYQMNDGNKDASEPTGRTIYLPILVTKELGQWTLTSNVGYTKAIGAGDDDLFIGVGAGHTVGRTSTVMAEVTTDRGANYERTDFRIGWVKVVFPKRSSRYQTSVFISGGKSLSSSDGSQHKMIRVGINVSLKPRTR